MILNVQAAIAPKTVKAMAGRVASLTGRFGAMVQTRLGQKPPTPSL
jgi:hypothetical protein